MPSSPRIEGFRSSHAVLIGIDRYGDGVPALRTPVADATKLAEILQQHGFTAEVVSDENATLDKLRVFLGDLRTRVGKDDRVLFYFAGHGIALETDEGPRGFLLPQDAARDSTDRYLPMVELNEALSALPCRHMLVILDCCFAGAFRWSSTRDLALAPENLHRERYAWYVQDAAWQAIASAAHDQKALDVAVSEALGERGETAGHSPFAKALIDGLAGAADLPRADGTGDGVITATELFLYLDQQLMPPGSGRPRQTPILWPLPKHDKGQFVFLVPGKELDLPPAPPLDPEANPWRGLKPYESTHADLFLGRRRASERLLEQVLRDQLVVVTGASGIGKSSLVRAGLLPRLPVSIHPIVVRPGPTPFASLATALASESPPGGSPDAEALRTDPPSALATWVKGQHSAGRQILLVIDQAEELITMNRDEEVTRQYLALIDNALNADERLRIAVTVRSEFEPQFAQSALKDRWLSSRYLVPQMTQDELRRVIEGPATIKVMRFESADLVDTLVNEVVQMPGALPLLSFALSEMYANYLRRRADDRTLTSKDYDALEGGVAGSLRVRANRLIDDLDEAHKPTARRFLERLVSVESGQFARRRVPRRELKAADTAENMRVEEVLGRLVDARLIVTDEVENEPYLELAHDALILGWDRLLAWVREDLERIIALRRLTPDVTEWERSGRNVKALLWSDAARSNTARALLSAANPGLNAVEKDFTRASLKRANTIRRARIATAAALSSLVVIAGLIAALYSLRVRQSEIDRLLSSAQSLQNSGDSARAYAFALAALEKSTSWALLWGDRKTSATSVLNSLLNEGIPQIYAPFRTTFSVSLSQNGAFLAAIGRGDVEAGRNSLILGAPNRPGNPIAEGPFVAGAFRPGLGEYFAASLRDNQVVIQTYDAISGKAGEHVILPAFQAPTPHPWSALDPDRQLTLKPGMVDEIAFSADGKTLMIAGWAAPDRARVLERPWRAYINTKTGIVEQYAASDQKVDLPPSVYKQRIAANDDGSRIVSAGLREIYVDSLSQSKRTIVGTYAHGVVADVAISPSGKQIIAGGESGKIALFQETPEGAWRSLEILLPGDADVELLQFISEEIIVASRSDFTISVARIQEGRAVDSNNSYVLRGHSGAIRSLRVDRKRRRLFSAGFNKRKFEIIP